MTMNFVQNHFIGFQLHKIIRRFLMKCAPYDIRTRIIFAYVCFRVKRTTLKPISIINDSLGCLISEILEYKRFLLNENAK